MNFGLVFFDLKFNFIGFFKTELLVGDIFFQQSNPVMKSSLLMICLIDQIIQFLEFVHVGCILLIHFDNILGLSVQLLLQLAFFLFHHFQAPLGILNIAESQLV